MRRHHRKRILVHILLVPSAFAMALPIVWMFILSFRPEGLIRSGIKSITSTEFVLEHYVTLFTRYDISQYVFNSVIGAVVPAFLASLVGLLGGYALIRFRFRGRQFFLSLPLFAQVIPAIQLLVPFYALMLILGVLDTYIAVILANTSLVAPFAVWMMTGYLAGVPREIEEAAMVDGCSRLGALFRVVIPIAMPGIGATFLLAFLTAWGEFLYPFVLTSSGKMRLLSVALYLFVPGSSGITFWGLMFATAVLFMTPAVLVFLLLQATFAKGLALGTTAGV